LSDVSFEAVTKPDKEGKPDIPDNWHAVCAFMCHSAMKYAKNARTLPSRARYCDQRLLGSNQASSTADSACRGQEGPSPVLDRNTASQSIRKKRQKRLDAEGCRSFFPAVLRK
jgi:hypothetical protein